MRDRRRERRFAAPGRPDQRDDQAERVFDAAGTHLRQQFVADQAPHRRGDALARDEARRLFAHGAIGRSIGAHAAVGLLLDRVHGLVEQDKCTRVVGFERIAHALAVQQRGIGASVVGQQQGVLTIGVAIGFEQQGELVRMVQRNCRPADFYGCVDGFAKRGFTQLREPNPAGIDFGTVVPARCHFVALAHQGLREEREPLGSSRSLLQQTSSVVSQTSQCKANVG